MNPYYAEFTRVLCVSRQYLNMLNFVYVFAEAQRDIQFREF